MTGHVAAARRCLAIAALILASGAPAAAQDGSRYRTYAMGDSLLAISRQIGQPLMDATSTPAVAGGVQELRWHARYVRRGTAPAGDPVDRLVFSFYEHRLFRIVVDYAPDRTEGMTEADMVAAVSAALRPTAPAHPGDDGRRRSAGTPGRDRDRPVDQRGPIGRAAGASGTHDVPGDRRLGGTPELARASGAREAPVDRPDWPSIEAARTRISLIGGEPPWQTTRRLNVASFVP